MKKIIIIGGGASGFFTAINLKEQHPQADVTILEKSKTVLQKVRISGGGRCNVTHACFEPQELVKAYPRGEKELLGSFHKFMSGDTFEWFEERGVPLKIEDDGRSFPQTNSSQSIINCFIELSKKLNITINKDCNVIDFYQKSDTWFIKTTSKTFEAKQLIIACGSSRKIWSIASKLNIKTIPAVPSLFTFKIKDNRIKDLGGISVPNATVKIIDSKLQNSGPLLITHWGLSGPAILKLSAFGARILAEKKYLYTIEVNWLSTETEEMREIIEKLKYKNTKKRVSLKSPFTEIPKRLWEKLVQATSIQEKTNWGDLSKNQLNELTIQLTKCTFNADGKSTFKEEFVTAGGINLKEINFKNFESKKHKNLFFVGEVLNIDAITGGYNFQNAWTSGFICAEYIAKELNKHTIS